MILRYLLNSGRIQGKKSQPEKFQKRIQKKDQPAVGDRWVDHGGTQRAIVALSEIAPGRSSLVWV